MSEDLFILLSGFLFGVVITIGVYDLHNIKTSLKHHAAHYSPNGTVVWNDNNESVSIKGD